ncbi:MAG TPA: VOC family protein [Candidatus Cybelea sp.]|nr:VOC family protein [Candidatus Cybelea sp.]
MISAQFVDHLVFRVAKLERTERFYAAVLGQCPDRAEDSVMFAVGDTRLFFTRSVEDQGEPYDKEKVGLNHLAFGVRTIEELHAIQSQLDTAMVQHSGIEIDRYGHKEFIWLDDPDGLRVEFYLRSR